MSKSLAQRVWRVKFLASQVAILIGQCPLSGHYFEPCFLFRVLTFLKSFLTFLVLQGKLLCSSDLAQTLNVGQVINRLQ